MPVIGPESQSLQQIEYIERQHTDDWKTAKKIRKKGISHDGLRGLDNFHGDPEEELRRMDAPRGVKKGGIGAIPLGVAMAVLPHVQVVGAHLRAHVPSHVGEAH